MRSRARKLVIVFNNLNIGGIERKIVDICNYFSQKRHFSLTLLLKEKNGPMLKLLPSSIKIASPAQKPKINTILFPLFISKQIKIIRPDAVVSFGDYSSICTILGKIICRSPAKVIVSEDSSINQQLNSSSFSHLRKLLVKNLYPLADKIIVLSNVGKKKIMSLIPNLKDVIVCPNWISPSFIHNLPPTNPSKNIDILFIGRFEKEKDPERFIKIIKLVSHKIPNIKCLMVGDGTLKPQIIKLINQLELTENINLLPSSTIVQGFYLSSKILLLTSKYEGFPLTILEACTANCLPVVKDIAEIKTFFKQHLSQLVFKNNREAAQKISYLLGKSSLRKQIVNHYHHLVINQQKVYFTKTINQFLQ